MNPLNQAFSAAAEQNLCPIHTFFLHFPSKSTWGMMAPVFSYLKLACPPLTKTSVSDLPEEQLSKNQQ